MRSIEENNSTEKLGTILRPWYEQVQPRLMDGPGQAAFFDCATQRRRLDVQNFQVVLQTLDRPIVYRYQISTQGLLLTNYRYDRKSSR
jgi:hypothetical protein